MTDPIAKYMQEYRKTPEYEKSILRDLWHYPSKGEYPTETGFYLVTLETLVGKERFVTMLNYSATLDNPTRRWIDCMGLEERRIVAWMPLPDPPKEEA